MKKLVQEILKSSKNKNLVILCGAGISYPKPANLPLALDLVNSVLSSFLEEYRDKFHFSNIRPEVIFHIVSKHEKKKLINLLSKLLYGENFNSIHSFLANSLKNGINVITTNFDDLIEKACITSQCPYTLVTDSHLNQQTPYLFKIHGSIDNPTSLMLTIDHINLGLTQNKLNTFATLLKDKTVLVLGYSGLDQLDIMPAMRLAKTNKIIWINHKIGQTTPLTEIPKNSFIAQLNNLNYISIDTELLIEQLGFSPIQKEKPKLIKIPTEKVTIGTKQKIMVDLLMHGNQYKQAAEFIDSYHETPDFYLRVARQKVANMIEGGSENLNSLNETLVSDILMSPPKITQQHFSYIVQVSQIKEIFLAIDEIFKALPKKQLLEQPISFYEGLVEAAYKAMLHHNYKKTEEFLDIVYDYSMRTGSIVLEARAYIILAGLTYFRFEYEGKDDKLIEKGLGLCDKAIFLMDSDIFNDQFYLIQALNNKAILLRSAKRYTEAIEIYSSLSKKTEKQDFNSHVHILFNMAISFFHLNDFENSLKYIEKAIKINKVNCRSILMGHILRSKANIFTKLN